MNEQADNLEYDVICEGTRLFRWRRDRRFLCICRDPASANGQQLICIARPENDKNYLDRDSLLSAAEKLMTDSFVTKAISTGINGGWTPTLPGQYFVVLHEDGEFVSLGESPI